MPKIKQIMRYFKSNNDYTQRFSGLVLPYFSCLPWQIERDCEEAIEETKNTEQRTRNEKSRIISYQDKIDSNLRTEVLSEVLSEWSLWIQLTFKLGRISGWMHKNRQDKHTKFCTSLIPMRSLINSPTMGRRQKVLLTHLNLLLSCYPFNGGISTNFSSQFTSVLL